MVSVNPPDKIGVASLGTLHLQSEVTHTRPSLFLYATLVPRNLSKNIGTAAQYLATIQ